MSARARFTRQPRFQSHARNACGWNEDIAEGVFAFEETVERGTTAIISPVRVTPSTCLTTRNSSSARLCLSVSPQIPRLGMFFYCSFEHPFLRPNLANKITSAVDSWRKLGMLPKLLAMQIATKLHSLPSTRLKLINF
jgi:hypothetical protein